LSDIADEELHDGSLLHPTATVLKRRNLQIDTRFKDLKTTRIGNNFSLSIDSVCLTIVAHCTEKCLQVSIDFIDTGSGSKISVNFSAADFFQCNDSVGQRYGSLRQTQQSNRVNFAAG
jgi:hypothetical protein